MPIISLTDEELDTFDEIDEREERRRKRIRQREKFDAFGADSLFDDPFVLDEDEDED